MSIERLAFKKKNDDDDGGDFLSTWHLRFEFSSGVQVPLLSAINPRYAQRHACGTVYFIKKKMREKRKKK